MGARGARRGSGTWSSAGGRAGLGPAGGRGGEPTGATGLKEALGVQGPGPAPRATQRPSAHSRGQYFPLASLLEAARDHRPPPHQPGGSAGRSSPLCAPSNPPAAQAQVGSRPAETLGRKRFPCRTEVLEVNTILLGANCCVFITPIYCPPVTSVVILSHEIPH